MKRQVLHMIGRFVWHWPFVTLGLATFALFVAAEALNGAAGPLQPALRVLIVPLWFMRTLEMVVGIGSWPWPLQLPVALPLLFVPYAAADLCLNWIRRRAAHVQPPSNKR